MKKRLLTLGLAALLFAGALTGILLSTSANEQTAFDPDTFDYEALYVGDAVIHFSAMDHKAGDTVDPTLATSEDGQQLLLEKINANMQTEWAYGDGYLEISTGSQLIASGIFAPADAENPEKGYTVEYIYGTVDKGLPQSATNYATSYPLNTWYGATSIKSFAIGSSSFSTYYIKDDALSELKALSASYLACANAPDLQSRFEFKPNPEHATGGTDGVLDYAQTKALLDDATLKKTYYFLDMDYTNVGNSHVAKTTCSIGGTWKADYDWKSDSTEIFRMPFNDVRQLNFLVSNTLGADGNYTESLEVYKDFAPIGNALSNTFGAEKLATDLLLAKDIGARIYAVRVYDRQLDTSEMQHNHVIDICRAYRLDPSFYTEADQNDRDVFKSALVGVRIGVDSKETVMNAIEQAANSVLKTEKNVYTDLYVQDNLFFMINPMTSTKSLKDGGLITTLSDLNGNFYPVGSSATPASYSERSVNLGLMQTFNLGKILPTEGTYTIRILYENRQSPLPATAPPDQVTKFVVGPATYRHYYVLPADDPTAKSGVTWSKLSISNGATGKLDWKADFETTYANGTKQPDLFAVDYGQITEFVNEITIGADVTVNIYRDGAAIATRSNTGGDLLPNALTIGPAINTDLYAIMVYTDVLTEEQKLQNHFADLMSYYQVDMTMFDKITSDKVRAKLYTALSDVKLGETSKDYLQGVLESYALTGGDLGVIKINDYVNFEGIQSRIEDYASARALFSFNTKALAELEKRGCEVEIGAILTPVTEENALEDLTVTYNPALGEYLASTEDAILKTFYRKGESFEGLYGFSSDEKRYFSATIPALDAATAGDRADQQYYMRAYLAVDYAGSNFVLYSNMESDLFGNSVSIREACDYFLFAGYADSNVLASLAGEYAAAAAKKTQALALTAHEKYNIAALASKLIQAARDGAVDANKQNEVASAGISIDMQALDAMRVGPLAASTKVQAELYATIGLEKYNVAKTDIVAAREAADELSASVYAEALAAGADEETAQAIRETATAQLLAMIGDVEAYVAATAEPLAKEMQEILDAFKEYTALLQLSKVFPAKATVFINGTTLVRYTIITDNEHLAIAENLQKLLLEHIGNTVGIYNIDNQYVGSHFDYTSLNTIMLGITENEINGDGLNYAVYGEGKCVYIEGSTLDSIEAAMAKFFTTYCAGTGRQQKTIDRGENALLNQTYTPLIAFNYGHSYPDVQCDSFDANGVYQVFLQKLQELPEEITVIDTVEVEDIPDSLKNVYYVATNGDDENDGKIDTPFRTLEAALAQVAYCGGGVVYLRGGTYEIDKTVTLNESHSGTLTAPLYISAYPGEEVTFTAAKTIDSSLMQSVDQAIAAGLVDASIKTRLNTFKADNSKNVYVVKLNPLTHPYGKPVRAEAYDKTNSQKNPEEVNQFYVDGELLHVARWPNSGAADEANYIDEMGRISFTDIGTSYDKKTEDVLHVGKVTTTGSSLYREYHTLEGPWKITFDNCLYRDHLLAYDKSVELYAYGAVYEEWRRDHYRLTLSVDEQGRNVMESDTISPYGAMEKAGNNLYFYNAIEDLDTNREYFMDYEKGLLYLYSDTPIADKQIRLSSTKIDLFDIAGASNVVVNGLSFTNTSGTGVAVRNSNRVIVQNCTFKDLQGNGVSLNDGAYCGVLKSDFSRTTGEMVITGSTIATLSPTHLFVQNNYFHDPNETQQIAVRLGGVGVVVSHNLIVDSVVQYNASFETVLEYNEILRGSQITFDSGPIYLGGANDKKANHVRYNYIHEVNVSKYGIYLDDLSTSNYVYGNIIHYAEENSGNGKCVNLHSANANVIYNNIGINADYAGIVTNLNYYVSSIDGVSTGVGGLGAYRWETYSPNHLMPKGVDPEKYLLRFPIETEISNLAEKHIADRALNPNWSASSDKSSITDAEEIFLRSSFYNVYLDNVMIHCGYDGYDISDPGNNRIFDRNLYYATPEDVGFVDYANRDFNLREDSAVMKDNPKIPKLPFDRMGRIEDLKNAN